MTSGVNYLLAKRREREFEFKCRELNLERAVARNLLGWQDHHLPTLVTALDEEADVGAASDN